MRTWRQGTPLFVALTMSCALVLLACGSEDPVQPTTCVMDPDCAETEFCTAGLCASAGGARHDLGGKTQAHVVLNSATGTLDLYGAEGKLRLRKAYGYAALGGFATELLTTKFSSAPVLVKEAGKDKVGAYDQLQLTVAASASRKLIWQIRLYADNALIFRLGLQAGAGAPKVAVDKLAPLRIREEKGGGLFLGNHPREHRILENGTAGLLDQHASLEMGDKWDSQINTIAPGKLEGYSTSNWSHLIWDSVGGTVWVAGDLATERAISVMNTSSSSASKAAKLPDGRTGFGFYSLDCLYLPVGKPVVSGQTLWSEPMYVHPAQTNVHQALEDYAQAIHDWRGLNTWTDRGLAIPNGWNSWTGSGGTGGYGTGISQALMEKNLAVMRDYFRDWGMDWFQMDDGYEPTYGDWELNLTRFPDGFTPTKGIVKKTLDAKLKPGIWIAAFSAYSASKLYKTYEPKGWFMDKTVYGALTFSDYMMLDMSNKEVLAWTEALFKKIRQTWGFVWCKLDFSYPALLATGFADPSLTNVEMYRQGLAAARRGLGKDTFFLNIGAMGIGGVDAMRLTMDTAPVWDWDPKVGTMAMTRQGLKPAMATGSRRYFYHGKVFVNHPDLILFRSDTRNTSLPRVTHEEGRAFAAYVAATGGIVKLGDRMVEDLAPYPKRVNVIRQLLPIHPQHARPLDLMTREFPEQWFKKITKPLAGYKESWGWYLAMNLGLNWDFSKNPAVKMADDGSERTFTLDPAAHGMSGGAHHVFEFWQQKYLGKKSGKVEVKVPAHDSRVYALRPVKTAPQFLGHNRHITMGAALVKSETWDAAARTLTLVMDAVKANKEAPFVYRVSFHGNGSSFKEARVPGAETSSLSAKETGEVLEVQFTPAKTGELKIQVLYK